MTRITRAGVTLRPLLLVHVVGCIFLLGSIAAPASAQPPDCNIISRSASGANGAAIQAEVDAFRAELGDDNGTGPAKATGRRELSWDGFRDDAPAFFNTDGLRFSYGVMLSSGARTERYQVSNEPGTGSTPPLFGNINASYPAFFQAFSGEQLFTPLGSNVLGVDFVTRVLGTPFVTPDRFRPATVRAFGAVFVDVDPATPSNTYMAFYGIDGTLLGTVPVPPFSRGLSFAAGIAPCKPIGRVKIQLGTGVIDQVNPQTDVVVMDNIVYSEPRPIQAESLDFDGDGKTDFAIYRPSNGGWYIHNTGTEIPETAIFGLPGDIPVPGDYNGDGRFDFAVFRPGTREWLVSTRAPEPDPPTQVWGQPGDIPVPFDYDHDGKTDIAVWRPSNGGFYIKLSSRPSGDYVAIYWGQLGDIPLMSRQ